jgi:hypothetical protein
MKLDPDGPEGNAADDGHDRYSREPGREYSASGGLEHCVPRHEDQFVDGLLLAQLGRQQEFPWDVLVERRELPGFVVER